MGGVPPQADSRNLLRNVRLVKLADLDSSSPKTCRVCLRRSGAPKCKNISPSGCYEPPPRGKAMAAGLASEEGVRCRKFRGVGRSPKDST